MLEVVTPERQIVSQRVDELIQAPGAEGVFGVLPGHCDFLTTLREGTLEYRIGQERFRYPLRGGFAEVRADRVIVLADEIGQEVT